MGAAPALRWEGATIRGKLLVCCTVTTPNRRSRLYGVRVARNQPDPLGEAVGKINDWVSGMNHA